MLPKISGIMEKWMGIPLKSGMLFWTGGCIAYTCKIGGLTPLWKQIGSLDAAQKTLLILALLLIMAISEGLIRRFETFVLRVLEGYHWPGKIRQWRVRDINKWFQEEENRFQKLADNSLSNAQEAYEFAQLDRLIMYMPKEELRLPTRLGNFLRAVELRPLEKYGLDAFVCWPHLWLLLPDHVRQEISQTRENLDDAVHIWIWGFLFIIWTVLAWWAIPAAILIMCIAYKWICQAAHIYGQLVEAAFDLYRHLLYKELRSPLPSNPAEETEQGRRLTEYLWRGSDEQTPVFIDPVNHD